MTTSKYLKLTKWCLFPNSVFPLYRIVWKMLREGAEVHSPSRVLRFHRETDDMAYGRPLLFFAVSSSIKQMRGLDWTFGLRLRPHRGLSKPEILGVEPRPVYFKKFLQMIHTLLVIGLESFNS